MTKESIREELRQHSLEELRLMLDQNIVPPHTGLDRKVFLALVIEVIREKTETQPFNPVF